MHGVTGLHTWFDVSVGGVVWKLIPWVHCVTMLQTRSDVWVGAVVWKLLPSTHVVSVPHCPKFDADAGNWMYWVAQAHTVCC